ncbi:ABC transporter substrate-binding protein [Cellulomonas denverensis]|uniref:Iron-siderophore ABC transporter substrate-binding protein n=1 Tax=Cellulomonas denverensis TaxID=264297 RepID=A0A7X6KU22_9CELL|nr:iron-siderophore ABC transporter substrate-binding protein [Cellulomonas denverensis]NKY22003.1 iron-siderophore ABC transporter substrate-binding protein [Cellulomonas denverensis]GIG24104.1 ABC transporter substrate-binding protein [Cellulomonas denverensis]
MSTRRTARAVTATLAVGTLALLAACGTTDAPAAESTSSAASDAGPVSITDDRGETVELDAPAQKVVSLEWMQTEMLASLGMTPVGAADVEGYTSWVGTAVPLSGDPEDVGTRGEPSVEAIASLEPDLIVGVTSSIPEGAMDQISRIAPVALFDGADAEDPIGYVNDMLTSIGTLVGKDDEAAEVIADTTQRIEDNAAAIADAGLEGTPVVFASPYAEGANVTVRMHGPRSAFQTVAVEMGLGSATEDPGDDAYGLSYLDVEGLTALPADTRFLYWGNDDEDDVVTTVLADNPIWQSLPFVQEGHVYRAGVGIWAYGGPESLAAWSDDLVAQLTAA